MRILIACECSGSVRDAFIAKGHFAMSCDLKDTESPGPHYIGDVFDIIKYDWDMMIAHPPCTYLAVSGACWMYNKDKTINQERLKNQNEALEFVKRLMDAPIPRIVIENPISVISTKIRKPDQIIQPYQFGHEVSKSTCLWLKNVPKLVPTNIVNKGEFFEWKCKTTGRIKRQSMWHKQARELKPKDRQTFRSRTFKGIAEAMANQWGNLK
jgi:hypothetical protein